MKSSAPRSSFHLAVVAACALAACGEATVYRRAGDLGPPTDPAADAGAALADAETGAATGEPPGAEAAALYIPFETMPPRARDGAPVMVSGSGATTIDGAAGLAVQPNTSTLTFAGSAADIDTGDFTILLWIRLTSVADQTILDKRTDLAGSYYGYTLATHSSKIFFQMGNTSIATQAHYSAGEVHADCDWHLVVITVDRAKTFGGRMYVDGKVVCTFVDADETLTNTAALRIGSTHFGDAPFLGAIDELMIARSVLGEDAITTYYRAVRARLPAPPDHC
jgi:hypothetical protein